jgi:23S rRNA (adenine2503-C2)-methyltransferase
MAAPHRDGQDFEMVFIPDADRGTLCVSSQVGCTLNCRFCHTGTMRLVRNLTPGEIVGQVMLARDALGEWPRGMAMASTTRERGRRGRNTAPTGGCSPTS